MTGTSFLHKWQFWLECFAEKLVRLYVGRLAALSASAAAAVAAAAAAAAAAAHLRDELDGGSRVRFLRRSGELVSTCLLASCPRRDLASTVQTLRSRRVTLAAAAAAVAGAAVAAAAAAADDPEPGVPFFCGRQGAAAALPLPNC